MSLKIGPQIKSNTTWIPPPPPTDPPNPPPPIAPPMPPPGGPLALFYWGGGAYKSEETSPPWRGPVLVKRTYSIVGAPAWAIGSSGNAFLKEGAAHTTPPSG